MSIVQEFKEFAVKGNVVDMAVGIIIIIGAAFGKIATSFVNDIAIFLLIKGINRLKRKEEAKQEAAPSKEEVLLAESATC